jgi:hypothetical protein
VQRGDDRHSQFAQERQDVAAGGPAVNAELVLQADDVHVADVEEVRGAQIGRQILLLDLEANHFRVLVAALDVVDRRQRHWLWGCAVCDRGQQVGRERGDAAFARQVVADKSDLADFRSRAPGRGRSLLAGQQLRNVGFGHFGGGGEILLLKAEFGQTLPDHEGNVH